MSRRAPKLSEKIFREKLESLPETSLLELSAAVQSESASKGLVLCGEGKTEDVIPVALTPAVVSREAARYLKGFCRGIRRTVNRILANYFEDATLQEILPLRENELKWLKDSCLNGIPSLQTIFERFDTNLGLNVDEGLSSFQILEFNAVGVGCIYLMPAATEILKTHLFSYLKDVPLQDNLSLPSDYRQLLLEDLKAHAKAIGCSTSRVAFIERRESTPGGSDEFTKMIPYFVEQGVQAFAGDPREVECRDGEFLLKGQPIDVFYRDFQLEEVVSIKSHGGSVDGIEAAFAKNRVVSTLFGEFDHKSLCELLTNPDCARYFTSSELRAARRRFPWTRLLYERRTTDWMGHEIDLIQAVREHRENLVLKPNRGYGGEGVVVGETVSAGSWEEALQQAIARPKSWVVQVKIPIAKSPVMVLSGSGKPKIEQQFVILSVTATSKGVAFVGRCSPDPVVNISQGGALVPVFLIP